MGTQNELLNDAALLFPQVSAKTRNFLSAILLSLEMLGWR